MFFFLMGELERQRRLTAEQPIKTGPFSPLELVDLKRGHCPVCKHVLVVAEVTLSMNGAVCPIENGGCGARYQPPQFYGDSDADLP